jgi:hypothetical protein
MLMESCSVADIVEELRRYIAVDSSKVIRFRDVQAVKLFDELRQRIVECVAGQELVTAREWLAKLKQMLDEVSKLLGVAGYTLPREFASFFADPLQHLKKKVFNYSYDYVRGLLQEEEFWDKAFRAVTTSLRTNLRSCYQLWSIAAIVRLLGDKGYSIAYPENRYLNFDRSGKQKLGTIPPNIIMLNIGKGYISFFHEAPRPLSWEDTADLQRVWSLYVALRPDLMVYSGRVLDIVDLSSNPPIKRPDVIVEFKELDEWWKRVRDLKGYFRKPLSAEEWRSKWIDGLFEGLAEAMGVRRAEVEKRVEEGASLRLKEYQLLLLYKTTYKPKKMFLVSRRETAPEIKKSLSEAGIEVIDGVGFEPRNLEQLVDELDSMASFAGAESVVIEIPKHLAIKLEELRRRLGLRTLSEVLEKLVSENLSM